jgi:putative inorganic carbon (hco3(-)) transporter
MLVGLVGAAVSRFYALLLYLWFALFRPQEWVWFDISSLRLSLILGIILVVPSILSGILPNLTHPLSIGSLLFLACGFIAQTNAVQPDVAWEWLDFLTRLILVSLLATTMLNSRRRVVLAVGVIGGSMGFHAAKAGLASLLGGGLQFAEGFAGAFTDNNGYALGAVMVMPMLMATGQALSQHGPIERWVRRAFIAAVPLTVLMVVGTFSRGGFLALAASVLTFLLLQKRRFAAIVLLLVSLAAALPFIPIQKGYVERMQTITDYQQEGSAETRIYFWGLAVDMAMDHPLGIGLRNFEYAYDQYDTTGGKWGHRRAVHSSFFQVLAETGFPGIVVWVVQCGLAFFVGWRIRRRSYSPSVSDDDRHFLFVMSNGLMVSMCGFLVGGMFLGLALNDLTWLTFGVLAGLDRLSLNMVESAALAPDAVSGGQP